MKARIPQRQRILNPLARPTIRAMLFRCAAQTLIEVFNFGGSGRKLAELEDGVKERLAKYDALSEDTGKVTQAMVADAKKMNIEYIVRPGSGEKVLVGREHDIVYLAYLMELRQREGWAEVRLGRFHQELCRRIRYYNRTFDGTPDMVLPVMDDRLARYGKRPVT